MHVQELHVQRAGDWYTESPRSSSKAISLGTILLFQVHTGSVRRRLELRTVTSHRTGLQATWGFKVMPESGSIVVWGQRTEDDPWTLCQFRLEGGKFQKVRQVEWPCEHMYHLDDSQLETLMVEGQELVIILCGHCRDIKLVHMETGDTEVACQIQEMSHAVCPGEVGRVWVCERDAKVRELDCSSKTFTETGRFVDLSNALLPWHLSYLPVPSGALILSHPDFIEAVSCETGEQLWELNGESVQPRGATFDPVHQLLLVADCYDDTILVLDPVAGSLLQTLPSPRSAPMEVVWNRGQLMTLHLQHGDFLSEISSVQLVDEGTGTRISVLLSCKKDFPDKFIPTTSVGPFSPLQSVDLFA